MKDCLVTEVDINNKKYFFNCPYGSPSQNPDKLVQFCTHFNLLLSNINNLYPTCSVLTGDFNVKCSQWCVSDKNNATSIELGYIRTASGYS